MRACSSAMLVKQKTYVTRRAVVGRAGTSRPTIDVGIAVGDIVNKRCGRTVRELRRVICGGASECAGSTRARGRRADWCDSGHRVPRRRLVLVHVEGHSATGTRRGSSASASRACRRASCATTRSASGTTALGLELADGDSRQRRGRGPGVGSAATPSNCELAAATRNSGSGLVSCRNAFWPSGLFSIDGRATKTSDLLVKWRGRPYDESSWERECDLDRCGTSFREAFDERERSP